MNSFLGFIVGLLQTTLSMLGVVQQHPEIPSDQQQQVRQVAQQAIDKATQAVNGITNSGQGMSKYTDTQYGFSLEFPSNATFVSRDNIDPWYMAGLQNGKSVIAIDLPITNSDVNRELVMVAVSTSTADFNTCAKTPPLSETSYEDLGNANINGQDFHAFATDDAGTGMYDTMQWYRAKRGNACIGIMYVISYGRGAETFPVRHALDTIVQSLVFVDTSTISVPGMTKYTDNDFGFSFWYPSGWSVTPNAASQHQVYEYQGGTVLKQIVVKQPTDSNKSIVIEEFNSPNASISPGNVGSTGAGCRITYLFNSNLHQWMQSTSDCDGPTTTAADVSHNTMGGLHEFQGAAYLNPQYIIPLSAHNFLVVTYEGDVHYGSPPIDPLPLVATILATDPSVATPVSAAEQTATIQAEKDAYTQQQKTSDASISVNVSPMTLRNANFETQNGDILNISWNSSNAPDNAAVKFFLVSPSGEYEGLIDGNYDLKTGRSTLPSTPRGTGTWRLPGPMCNSDGVCLSPITGGEGEPTITSVEPGAYYLIAKLYTPANVYFGGDVADSERIAPIYLATATSSAIIIRANSNF